MLPPGPTQRPLANLARFVGDPFALVWDAAAEYGQVYSLQLAGQPTWVCVGEPQLIERVLQLAEPPARTRGARLLPGLAWARGELGDAPAASIEPELALRHVDAVVDTLRADQRIRASELFVAMLAPIVVEAVVAGEREAGPGLLVQVLEAARTAARAARSRGAAERLTALVIDPHARLRQALARVVAPARASGLARDLDELLDLVRDLVEGCALTLAWALWLLSTHRVLRERVVEEARDATLGSRMSEALVDETLRVRPVVLARVRVLAYPLVLGEWSLPPATWVLASQALAHVRGDVWESAFEFRPERFGSATRPSAGLFFPLGSTRSHMLARGLMSAVLQRLLARVDLHVAAEANPRPAACGRLIGPSDGVPLVIERVLLTSRPRVP